VPPHWLAVLLVLVTTAGCASLPVVGPTLLLVRADHLAREGAWEAAVASYDEFLARFPEDSWAPRVLRSRDTLAATLGARVELTRRREEVDRLRSELARLQLEEIRLWEDWSRLRTEATEMRDEVIRLRDERSEMRDEVIRLRDQGMELREELNRRKGDLVRARQELGAQQAEAERLKTDIERLKQIDLKPGKR
jgi:septal ring factor EnvC (AmiA/AmiB activator)